jgi:hypothetical protein
MLVDVVRFAVRPLVDLAIFIDLDDGSLVRAAGMERNRHIDCNCLACLAATGQIARTAPLAAMAVDRDQAAGGATPLHPLCFPLGYSTRCPGVRLRPFENTPSQRVCSSPWSIGRCDCS